MCTGITHMPCAPTRSRLRLPCPCLCGLGRRGCDVFASRVTRGCKLGKELSELRSFQLPAPTTPIVFKGGLGHEKWRHLHIAGVHVGHATGLRVGRRSWSRPRGGRAVRADDVLAGDERGHRAWADDDLVECVGDRHVRGAVSGSRVRSWRCFRAVVSVSGAPVGVASSAWCRGREPLTVGGAEGDSSGSWGATSLRATTSVSAQRVRIGGRQVFASVELGSSSGSGSARRRR
jgi:hypothetical protein